MYPFELIGPGLSTGFQSTSSVMAINPTKKATIAKAPDHNPSPYQKNKWPRVDMKAFNLCRMRPSRVGQNQY